MSLLSMRHMGMGQEGMISSVKAGGEIGRRLRDMGLIKGTLVKILRRAPLFDPVAIRIKGFTLTLRNNEADYIDVEVKE